MKSLSTLVLGWSQFKVIVHAGLVLSAPFSRAWFMEEWASSMATRLSFANNPSMFACLTTSDKMATFSGDPTSTCSFAIYEGFTCGGSSCFQLRVPTDPKKCLAGDASEVYLATCAVDASVLWFSYAASGCSGTSEYSCGDVVRFRNYQSDKAMQGNGASMTVSMVASDPSDPKQWVITGDSVDGSKTWGGSFCSKSADCASGTCKSRCCRGYYTPGCMQCNTDGKCNTCDIDYTYDTSNQWCTMSKSDGTTCSSSLECASGNCQGDRCCKSNVGEYCTSCGTLGSCQSCSSEAVLNAGVCDELADAGESCTGNAACKSNTCVGFKCCSGSGDHCTACGVDGLCSGCMTGYILSEGQCISPKPAGQSCSSNAECSSDKCLAGHCCKDDDAAANCQSCASGSGACDDCMMTYVLKDGECTEPAEVGSSCDSDTECESSACVGGRCCLSILRGINCLSCGQDGMCEACHEGFQYNQTAQLCTASSSSSDFSLTIPEVEAGTAIAITIIIMLLVFLGAVAFLFVKGFISCHREPLSKQGSGKSTSSTAEGSEAEENEDEGGAGGGDLSSLSEAASDVNPCDCFSAQNRRRFTQFASPSALHRAATSAATTATNPLAGITMASAAASRQASKLSSRALAEGESMASEAASEQGRKLSGHFASMSKRFSSASDLYHSLTGSPKSEGDTTGPNKKPEAAPEVRLERGSRGNRAIQNA